MVKRALQDVDNSSPRTPKKTKLQTGVAVQHSTKTPLAATPSNTRTVLVGTPLKHQTPTLKKTAVDRIADVNGTPKGNDTETTPSTKVRAAARNDASAKKKSKATLQRLEAAQDVDSDAEDGNIAIAKAILSDADDGEDSSSEEAPQAQDAPQDVPVKRGRGRPKGSKRARTPTPPPDMPAQEMYFFRNRTTASNTSSNVLPAHLLLNHDDYLAQMKAYQDPHTGDIERLKDLHSRSYEQWHFELEEHFSICLYGFGSKRNLMMDFADFLYDNIPPKAKIAVVNGYNHYVTMKDILLMIAGQILPTTNKLPNQPTALLDIVLKALDKHASRIYLFVHSLDSSSLRKAAIQASLAKLASHKQICMIASCDNLNFGLLWDLHLLRQFNFAFHDATTFEPWTVEIDTVEEVNLLLGRSSRRLTGKDGIGYVLKSLPENARNLFKMLVTEQLTLEIAFEPGGAQVQDDDEDMLGVSDEELAAMQQTPSKRGRGRPKKVKDTARTAKQQETEGVEYRALYHKAVEEFVCSSEVNFRTLLKEFHDHQMIVSRKDLMGTERLIVPFRQEELEAILEEL